MELSLVVVVVFAMLVVVAVYLAPILVVYLQHLDILYNFEHYASNGNARLRTQTALGILIL